MVPGYLMALMVRSLHCAIAFVNIRYVLVLLVAVVGIGYAFSSNQAYVARFESTFNISTDGSNLAVSMYGKQISK